MKFKTRSIICTVIVIAVILGTMLTAGAGVVWFNKNISTSGYTYLTSSVKTTDSSYGVVYNTVVTGDSFASVRAGNTISSTVRVVTSNNLYSVQIPTGYNKVGVAVSLFGMAQGGTTQLAGNWNPDF